MLESSRKINDLMKAQVCIYKEIASSLDKTVNNKQGSVWAYEQVNEINALFDKLKVLDEQGNKIIISKIDFKNNPELEILKDELTILVINVKRRIGLLQTRIKGGQQHVLSSIKNVIRDMGIKGYKNNLITEPRTCIS